LHALKSRKPNVANKPAGINANEQAQDSALFGHVSRNFRLGILRLIVHYGFAVSVKA
jgi:hypothetical protein